MQVDQLHETTRMPALFIGHGNPMNAVEENKFTKEWQTLGLRLPRPKAILCISAHWFTEGSFVTTAEAPQTMHDFYGFPQELYDIDYRCSGASDIARAIESLATRAIVTDNRKWGLDHGTWVPLLRMYPEADIPTTQLSIDMSQPSRFHYDFGRELTTLRNKGVLIIGSGNIVHNLGRIDFDPKAQPYDWSIEFDEKVRELIDNNDHESLIEYENLGRAAMLSIPTPDHYWPLLYILGLINEDDEIAYPVEGIAHGSISMRAVVVGM